MLNASDTQAPVVVLLAGEPGRVTNWYSAFLADARFRVQSFATDAEDLSRKLSSQPEVVVVDAALYKNAPALIEMLTRLEGVAYVVMPVQADEAARMAVGELPCVKGVFIGDVNIAQLIGKLYTDALARRHMAPGAAAPWAAPGQRPGAAGIAGLRLICVWNQCGGSGKSTLAANLAYEAARRGMKTLLIGLGAPDVMPLMIGLNSQPNLMLWRAQPGRESLLRALQRLGDLDVLAGFPDVLAEAQVLSDAGALADKPDTPTPIALLAHEAAYAGYAVVVLDTPHSALAGMALAAANTLLLVARPTYADVWASVAAYRLLTERLKGQHRIAPENVYVVLNRARARALTANEWHGAAAAALKRPFPAVAATISEDPEIEAAANAGKMALLQADGFARQLRPLADALLGGAPAADKKAKEAESLFKFGPVVFRTK